MKRGILVTCIVVALFMLLACSNEIVRNDVDYARVRFTKESSREIASYSVIPEVENLYWTYTAEKQDAGLHGHEAYDSPLNGGETGFGEAYLPFEPGAWTFTLKGYLAYEDGAFLYQVFQGSKSVVLEAGENSAITVLVELVIEEGIGIVDFSGIVPDESREGTSIKAFIEGDEILNNTGLPTGIYQVTFKYVDAAENILSSETLFVPVTASRVTYVLGTMSLDYAEVHLDARTRIRPDEVVVDKDPGLVVDTNKAVPSIVINEAYDVSVEIEIRKTDSDDFIDSRSIIGDVIDIDGDNFTNAELTFALSEEVEFDDEAFLVCRYNDDGSLDYYVPEYDEGSRDITAEIDGKGTYFVLDVKTLIKEFGRLNEENDHPETPVVQADIVFIIDTTGSMSDEINNVRNNIVSFADSLSESGISAALALIDYQDITHDGYDSTVVHKNGTSNWFYDIEEFKSAIASLRTGDGGDAPETAVDALETARLLDLRDSAGKVFILITDATYKNDNRYSPSLTMEEEIQLLVNAGISCSVICPTAYQSSYSALYTSTGGIYADIYGNFQTQLMNIAESIDETLVGYQN